MNVPSPQCPNCGGDNLYRSEPVSAGPHMQFLRGLGGFLRFAQFVVVACADCGLVRFFADQEATGTIPHSEQWRKL